MTNPLRKHANSMFASKGCDFDKAMDYATEVLFSLSTDKAAAMTALMVVVNTAANAFDQAHGPSPASPEKLAIIELIDSRINEHKLVRSEDLESKVQDWIESNLDLDDVISEWMGNNFDITDYDDNIDWDAQLGDRISDGISDWMSDNLSDKISDLDLVVRTR